MLAACEKSLDYVQYSNNHLRGFQLRTDQATAKAKAEILDATLYWLLRT